ncbi:MAG: SH3 domain-containing protein [Paracoccaceae bacterium]
MTFAFLGWSFYQISGGADYQPREGSRQAVALQVEAERKLAALSPNTMASAIPAASAPDKPEVTRNLIDLTSMPAVTDRSAQPVRLLPQDLPSADTLADTVDKRVANLSLAQPAAFAQAAGMAPVSPENLPQPAQDLRDLRHITGTSVNMRTGPGTSFGVLARVTRDTEVEVLETYENGWLRLRVIDSSKVGWVSSKLVSDAPVSDQEG